MNKKVQNIIWYLVLFGVIICCGIAGATGLALLCKGLDLGNVSICEKFLGSIFLMFVLLQIVRLFYQVVCCCSERKRMLLRCFLCLSIFALQMLCLNGLGKITLTEDSFKVIDMASDMVRDTHGMLDNTIKEPVYDGYFARYSNNHVITIFFYYFFSVIRFFGCEQFILAARILNIILLDFGIFLAYFSARKMWGSKKADLVLLLMTLSPTTYVWLFWSYTNTFSIPFVMGILLLYLYGKDCESHKKTVLYGICAGAVGVIGYFLRPTTIIPIIAVIMMQFFSSKSWKKFGIWLASFGLVALVAAGGVSGVCKMHLTDTSSKESFPITHWIMLGLSEQGGYNKEDVRYTKSFSSKEEKQQANMTEIKKRIKKRNVFGMAKLVAKKLYRVYGDGEDNFTQQKKYSENQTILYNYMYGERNGCFLFYCKVFRLFVLGCIMIQSVFMLRERKAEFDTSFAYALTLFGSMLFFLIWEANNKYSISFEYVMLLLAAGAIGRKSKQGCKESKQAVKRYQIAALCQIGITIVFCIAGWNNFVAKERTYEHDLVDIQKEKSANVITDVAEHNIKLEQSFLANAPFDHVELYTAKQNTDCETVYQVSILDEERNVLVEKQINAKDKCIKKEMVQFSFSEIVPEKKMQTYFLCVEAASGNEDFIEFRFNEYLEQEKYEGGALKIGNTDTKKDLCMRIYDKQKDGYSSKAWYIGSFLVLVVVEIVFWKVCSKQTYLVMQTQL